MQRDFQIHWQETILKEITEKLLHSILVMLLFFLTRKNLYSLYRKMPLKSDHKTVGVILEVVFSEVTLDDHLKQARFIGA